MQCCLEPQGFPCPRKHSWDNIAQIKTLCSVFWEAPNTIVQEKILYNVVLIPLGQHYTGKNPIQCCPWGSRQQCTGKNPVQYCLNTLGTLHRLKPYAMLSLLSWDNIAQEKIQAMLSEQHLVIYYEDILPLLWKPLNKPAKHWKAAWYSNQQLVKLLVRCYLNK